MEGLQYIVAQIVGAVLAMLLATSLLKGLGHPAGAVPANAGFWLAELLGAFILTFVVTRVVVSKVEVGAAAFAIGLALAIGIGVAGAFSGGVLNPAIASSAAFLRKRRRISSPDRRSAGPLPGVARRDVRPSPSGRYSLTAGAWGRPCALFVVLWGGCHRPFCADQLLHRLHVQLRIHVFLKQQTLHQKALDEGQTDLCDGLCVQVGAQMSVACSRSMLPRKWVSSLR